MRHHRPKRPHRLAQGTIVPPGAWGKSSSRHGSGPTHRHRPGYAPEDPFSHRRPHGQHSSGPISPTPRPSFRRNRPQRHRAGGKKLVPVDGTHHRHCYQYPMRKIRFPIAVPGQWSYYYSPAARIPMAVGHNQ